MEHDDQVQPQDSPEKPIQRYVRLVDSLYPQEIRVDQERVLEDSQQSKLFLSSVDQALDSLTPQERLVLELRFGLIGDNPQTLAQVAPNVPRIISEGIGVHPERVRQIEAKALRKLRGPLRFRHFREFMVYTSRR